MRVIPFSELTQKDLNHFARTGQAPRPAVEPLPDGWRQLKGVSGSGWDVWLCYTSKNREGHRFAIFHRRLDVRDTPFTLSSYYGTTTDGEAAFKEIHRAFQRGDFSLEMVQDPALENPLYGSF